MNRFYWALWGLFGMCGTEAGCRISQFASDLGFTGESIAGYRYTMLWIVAWTVATLAIYTIDSKYRR